MCTQPPMVGVFSSAPQAMEESDQPGTSAATVSLIVCPGISDIRELIRELSCTADPDGSQFRFIIHLRHRDNTFRISGMEIRIGKMVFAAMPIAEENP